MLRKLLGRTDLLLSNAGLGAGALCARLPGETLSVQEGAALLLHGLSLGINWIETDLSYAQGAVDELVGKVAREWKDEVLLISRHGPGIDNRGRPALAFARSAVIKRCEDMLRRVRREAIDLYFLPAAADVRSAVEGYAALLDLRRQGKVRWLGVCALPDEQLQAIAAVEPPQAVIAPCNLLEAPEEALLRWQQSAEVPLIACSILCRGLLTNRVSREWFESLPETHWAHRDPRAADPAERERLCRFSSAAAAAAAVEGISVQALAVSKLLASGPWGIVLGARSKAQLEELCAAAMLGLSPAQSERIEEARADFRRADPVRGPRIMRR